jgi:hypothetical protein
MTLNFKIDFPKQTNLWIQHWKMSGKCFHCRIIYFFLGYIVFLSVRVFGFFYLFYFYFLGPIWLEIVWESSTLLIECLSVSSLLVCQSTLCLHLPQCSELTCCCLIILCYAKLFIKANLLHWGKCRHRVDWHTNKLDTERHSISNVLDSQIFQEVQ